MEPMSVFGFLAFVLLICYINLPSKVNRLSSEVKKLKSSVKGKNKMSEMLKELEGKMCKITTEGSFAGPVECKVINVDDDWMKITYTDKKGNINTKIIKIDNINEISLL